MEKTYAIRTDNLHPPYAIIGFSYGKLRCLSCQNKCKHLQELEKIFQDADFFDNSDMFELFSELSKTPEASNIYSLKTLSSSAIPFTLTTAQKENFCKNIADIFIEEDGVLQVIPTDISRCQHCSASSDQGNLVPMKEISWIVSRYGFREAQCFHQCCSTCGNLMPYDGQGNCLLNMGRFLVHYEVLRDYMFQFFHSSSPISRIQSFGPDTFTGNVQSSQVSDQESLPLACYPSLLAVRKRGRYEADTRKPLGSCRKTGARHPSLLPGIFTVFCPHGVCYGFEVMVTAESPNVPFTFLKTRFEQPPEIVIYDNACNLFQYALNRDPAYFKDTRFLIDSLHWPNHKKCAAGYEARSYPRLKGINTQIVEQNNAKIRKLKSSLSYMKPENFMDTLKLFLWYNNEQINKKYS